MLDLGGTFKEILHLQIQIILWQGFIFLDTLSLLYTFNTYISISIWESVW